jgi:hypothetical protein
MLDPEHSVSEQRHLLIGMSSQQRLCVEAFAERPPRTGLISARGATPQERRRWHGPRCDRDQAEHKVSIDEGVAVFGVRSRHERHPRTLGPIGLGAALPQRTPC